MRCKSFDWCSPHVLLQFKKKIKPIFILSPVFIFDRFCCSSLSGTLGIEALSGLYKPPTTNVLWRPTWISIHIYSAVIIVTFISGLGWMGLCRNKWRPHHAWYDLHTTSDSQRSPQQRSHCVMVTRKQNKTYGWYKYAVVEREIVSSQMFTSGGSVCVSVHIRCNARDSRLAMKCQWTCYCCKGMVTIIPSVADVLSEMFASDDSLAV